MKLHIVRHTEAVDQSSVLPDDYRYLSCRGRTWFRRVAGTLKIKLQQPETVASFLWLVTGGGKLITNHETAMVRLTGGEDQPKEDDLRKQERYRTSSSSDTGSDNLATLCLLSACAMPKVGHSCVARNNRPNQQITVK